MNWNPTPWGVNALVGGHLFEINHNGLRYCVVQSPMNCYYGPARNVLANVDSIEEGQRFCEWVARALDLI